MSFTLKNNGILALKTELYAFQFAAMLNRLYGWRLMRDTEITFDDLGGSGTQLCPLYFYLDTDKRLLYFLIDNPVMRSGGIDKTIYPYDKILLINGNNAFEALRELHKDFTERARRDMTNKSESHCQREIMRFEIANKDIILADFFDFSKCDGAEYNEYSINNIGFVSLSEKSAKIYSKPGNALDYLQQSTKGMGLSSNAANSRLASMQKVETSILDTPSSAKQLQDARLRYLKQLKNVSNHILKAIEVEMNTL